MNSSGSSYSCNSRPGCGKCMAIRNQPLVQTGLDVLRDQSFAPLRGLRIGLVTHPAAADSNLRHICDLLAKARDVQLKALFGPEHGLLGHAQDLIGVSEKNDPILGLRVYSLYGDTVESL